MKNLYGKLNNFYFWIFRFFGGIIKNNGLFAREKNKIELHPAYYWKIIIFIFSFSVIFSFLANFLFFWYLNRVEIVENGSKTAAKNTIQKRDLFEIVNRLNQKKEVFQKLLNEKIDIQEP